MKRKSNKFWGALCGIGAAVCYGTNPLGALNLYAEGLSTNLVLLYRFGIALIMVGIVLLVRKESLKVTPREFGVLSILGLLFIGSSFTLYSSFHYMDAGIASTILFTYPVMTAIIMAVLFKEKPTYHTVLSILLSLLGVALLYWGDGNGTLSTLGVVLVLISALTYSVYIIIQNRSHLCLSPFQVNFYIVLYCALFNLLCALITGEDILQPLTPRGWFFVGWLAIVPTIFALILLTYAARSIGSTPTSIMGALEPLTAVVIGIVVFHEHFSIRLAIGILLILTAVFIIVMRSAKPSPSKPR